MLHVLGCLTEQHDLRLVGLAAGLCFFACLTAMSMISRARIAVGRTRLMWLAAAGLAAGNGIWATHFVAMLAYQSPLPVAFALDLTIFSGLIAIVVSALGYWLSLGRNGALVGGAVVGLAIGAMHYVGMAAVRMPADVLWQPIYVAVSLGIGMILTTLALAFANRVQSWRGILGGAVLFTLAIVGMHFTGMSAITYRPDPLVPVPEALVAPLALAVVVAATAFLILCLAMVCVFADRRFTLLAEREAESLRAANLRLRAEIEDRQAITRELLTSNTALTATQGAIRALLDNADQGFLTVADDLLVGEQASAACEAIFGAVPIGRSIVDLLCTHSPPGTSVAMRVTLQSLFRNSCDYIRELKFELLPTMFDFEGKLIKVNYKYLASNNKIMLILTDVTQTALLTEAVECERRRLEMVVLAVTDGEAFTTLVTEYRAFLNVELPSLLDQAKQADASIELRRRVHTYKGLLAQYSFHHSPRQLHDLESKLMDTSPPLGETVGELEALHAEFARDLKGLYDVLGPDFESSDRRIALSMQQMQVLEEIVEQSLTADEESDRSPPLRLLQKALWSLRKRDVKAALALHSRGAPALAARLQKQLSPVLVEGDEISLDPKSYSEFLRSLVHVFRNAVDHGIESPAERATSGKAVAGVISCNVHDLGDWLEITIKDDGRGVDREALLDKLMASGLQADLAATLSLDALVFRDGLSSRNVASEVSGRGVGLAAVKAELDRIGGAVAVTTERGIGTQFRFRLPIRTETARCSPSTLETAA